MDSHPPDLEMLVLAGRLMEASSVCDALPHLSPREMRWAGLIHLILREYTQAQRVLEQAYREGEVYAALHLCTLNRFQGNLSAAAFWLERCPAPADDPVNQTLLLREQAHIKMISGGMRECIDQLEVAWVTSFTDERCAPLRRGLAQALGYAHLARGSHARALEHFGRALQDTDAARAVFTYGAKGVAHAYLGHISLAREALAAVGRLQSDPRIGRSLTAYQWGTVELAAWEMKPALEHFERAVEFALEEAEGEMEFYAQLGRCAVFLARNEIKDARRAVARAGALADTPKLRALLAWRQGCVAVLRGDREAGALLENAYQTLLEAGRLREAGWATLWQAELSLREGGDLERDLERLTEIASALGDAGWTLIELPALSYLRVHLQSLEPGNPARGLLPNLPIPKLKIELRVLGEAALFIDGRPARTHYTRIAEFVYYLIKHPESSIGEILSDLFPDDPPQRGRNYVHQMRNDLKTAVGGLIIQCDAEHRYSVQYSEVEFTCDALILEQNLERDPVKALVNYQALLPLSEGDWAAKERERLMGFITKIGLKCLNQWFEAAEYKHCVKLTERLLEVDPLDSTMSVYLLEALHQLEGTAASQQRAQRMLRTFAQEGFPPLTT